MLERQNGGLVGTGRFPEVFVGVVRVFKEGNSGRKFVLAQYTPSSSASVWVRPAGLSQQYVLVLL